MQRQLGANSGIVMEGRDIGTTVFPQAQVKIFLDAAAEVRGQRRYQQNGPGTAHAAESVLEELRERDRRDRTRAESPLAAGGRRSDHRFHRSFARPGGGPGGGHHHGTTGCPLALRKTFSGCTALPYPSRFQYPTLREKLRRMEHPGASERAVVSPGHGSLKAARVRVRALGGEDGASVSIRRRYHLALRGVRLGEHRWP